MEINNELIPHILKADGRPSQKHFFKWPPSFSENLVSDPECFGHLVRFYDGLCSWEEESSTPVLHIGWVKPIVKCFTAFDYHVRAKLDIARVEDHDQGKSALLALSDLGLATIPDRLNNNYKDSVEDCDIRECDKESGHYDMKILKEEEKSIYLPTNPDHPSARVSHVRCEDFEKMHVNRLLRLASLPHSDVAHSEDPKKHSMLISHMIEHAGEKLFNVKFLLGNCISMDEAFLEPSSPSFPSLPKSKAIDSTFLAEASSSRPAGGKASHLRTTSSSTAASATKTSKTLKKTSSARDGRVKVSVYSSKIGDIKPLLLCEKLNSSALHLHLTAQSQTEVKKSRNSSFEADFAVGTAGGRVKRQRREWDISCLCCCQLKYLSWSIAWSCESRQYFVKTIEKRNGSLQIQLDPAFPSFPTCLPRSVWNHLSNNATCKIVFQIIFFVWQTTSFGEKVSEYIYLYQPLKSQMPHFEQMSSFYIDTGESYRFCYDDRIYVDLLEYMSNK